jgi:hypothetical protein
MVNVTANVSVTSVDIHLSEQDASKLMKILQETILWQDSPSMGRLAQEIVTSLEALDVQVSPVKLTYSPVVGAFVEELVR